MYMGVFNLWYIGVFSFRVGALYRAPARLYGWRAESCSFIAIAQARLLRRAPRLYVTYPVGYTVIVYVKSVCCVVSATQHNFARQLSTTLRSSSTRGCTAACASASRRPGIASSSSAPRSTRRTASSGRRPVAAQVAFVEKQRLDPVSHVIGSRVDETSRCQAMGRVLDSTCTPHIARTRSDFVTENSVAAERHKSNVKGNL